MFAIGSELFPDNSTFRRVFTQSIRHSAVPEGPDHTVSHLRSRKEKLTGILIILSILSLILTF